MQYRQYHCRRGFSTPPELDFIMFAITFGALAALAYVVGGL